MGIRGTFNANNWYVKWAKTCYKTFHLFYNFKVFIFCKNGATLFPKNKIQKMSPNFVHFMYLFFERILLRWNFWGIPLRCNVTVCDLAVLFSRGGNHFNYYFRKVDWNFLKHFITNIFGGMNFEGRFFFW